MKVRQKNLRVFEFVLDNRDATTGYAGFCDYVSKSRALLSSHLLLVRGGDGEVARFLDEQGLAYRLVDDKEAEMLAAGKAKPAPSPEEAPASPEPAPSATIEAEKPAAGPGGEGSLTFHRPIRSGEEVNAPGDLVLFGRVNSGARITVAGNLLAFGPVDGVVSCEGAYLMARAKGSGALLLKGEPVDQEELDGSLKIFRLKEGGMESAEVE